MVPTKKEIHMSRRSTIQAPPIPKRKLQTIVLIVGIILLRLWIPTIWEAHDPKGSAAVSTQGPPPVHISWLPSVMEPQLWPLAAACIRHDVDPELCVIIALVESGGNPRAISEAGAVGIMQVMPTTGQAVSRERQVEIRLDNVFINIDTGAWILADEFRIFGLPEDQDPDQQESVTLVAAAYNGGRYAASQLDYSTLQIGGDCAQVYPRVNEDQMYRYACFVGGMWHERHWETSPTFQTWLDNGQSLIAAAEAADLAR